MLKELLDNCTKNKSLTVTKITQDIYSITNPESLLFTYNVHPVWSNSSDYKISKTYYDYGLYKHREEDLKMSYETPKLSTLLNNYVLSRSNKALNASNTQVYNKTCNINTNLNYLYLVARSSASKISLFSSIGTVQYYIYEKDDEYKFPLLMFHAQCNAHITKLLKKNLDTLLAEPKYKHLALGVIETCMFNSNTIEELFIFRPGQYNILTEFEYDLQLNVINDKKLPTKNQELVPFLISEKTKSVFNLSEDIVDVIDYLITASNGNFTRLIDNFQNLFNKDFSSFSISSECIADTYALYFVLVDYMQKAFNFPDSDKFYLYNKFINTFITKNINVVGQNYKTESSD